nr:AAA domain-containing protein [Bacteriovorax sp. HI3]
MKILRKYQELICNFQKKNKELLYRPSPYSINFSNLTLPQGFSEPFKVRQLFKEGNLNNETFLNEIDSGEINLSEHFLLKFENSTLRSLINKVRLEDDSFQKEFGISGAWFIGPFLMWKTKEMAGEGEVDNIFISPIFKCAVDFKKNKSKQEIVSFEEDGKFQVNPTLRILLKKEYGVNLEKEYFGKIKDVLSLVNQAISQEKITLTVDVPGKEVFRIPAKSKTIVDDNGKKKSIKIPLNERFTAQEINQLGTISSHSFIIQDIFYIDVFNASKMSLYYDYEEIIKNYNADKNNLIENLVSENNYPSITQPTYVDCEKNNFYVVDIDGSQHKAIKDSSGNSGFVIQGPPGTGKSQTITNMIAQYLAEGKKVLFVAEKKAALDVVFSRLAQTGLDKHSVILHDNQVNKNALYRSYVTAFNSSNDDTIGNRWADISEGLNYQNINIKKYFEELSAEAIETNISNYNFFSRYSSIPKYDLTSQIYKYFSHLTLQQLDRSKLLIEKCEEAYVSFGRYKESKWPWFKDNFLSEVAVSEFGNKAKKLTSLKNSYLSSKAQLDLAFPQGDHLAIERLNVPEIKDIDYEIASTLVNKCLKTEKSKEVLYEINGTIEGLKANLSSFKVIKKNASVENITLLRDYFSVKRNFFKYFSLKFWEMANLAKQTVENKSYFERGDIYKDWIYFTSFEEELKLKLSTVYNAIQLETSDKDGQIEGYSRYLKFADFVLGCKQKVSGERFNVDFDSKSLNSLITDLKKGQLLSKEASLALSEIEVIGKDLDNQFLHKIGSDYLSYDSELNDLISKRHDFPLIQNIRIKIAEVEKELSVQNFDFQCEFFQQQAVNWFDYIQYHLMSSLRDRIYSQYPNINLFSSTKMNKDVTDLLSLLTQHKEFSKQAVDYFVHQKRSENEIPTKILKMIENEAGKSRRIKSPREVMENGALDVMLNWKRCWLMSPLSISQMLPNIENLFDVVIFDEASQVRIEDAIPSIFRAKSLVVVGDNKQMPPTNFFGSSIDEDDEEEDDIDGESRVEIAESLLDQASKKYPSLMLEWHYRSEHEALIAFSNYAYYEGRLVVAPNPRTLCSSRAIEFFQVENAVFDSSHGNIIEAQEIVQIIKERLLEDAKASIGVISMGVKQQKAIDKILERLCEENEAFSKAYNFSLNYCEEGSFKGFFNRNLENVQGDERDEIILSVGYGHNKEGKLRKSFGPLSKAGGGRRLNVAITRARKNMKVFCSYPITGLAIDAEAYEKNPNTATFSRFLHYALSVSKQDDKKAIEILNLFPSGQISSSSRNILTHLIAKSLRAKGYKIEENVGTCGFSVDLGVLKEDSINEFYFGIDLNYGIKEHNAFLRDSFKNREMLLSKRGWKIYNVWLQDWISQPDKVIQEIEERLKSESLKKIA